MDGRSARLLLANTLNEATTSTFIEEGLSWDYLYEAALEYNRLTKALTGSQSITTVAETSAYDLNADFQELRVRDGENNFVVKYYDGTYYSWIPFRPYEAAYYSNNTSSVSIPSTFSVTDNQTAGSLITGTATSTAAASQDTATLTDTAGDFTNASVGDSIHNTTDGSDGYILSKTSTTVIVTALFGGTNNYWTSADAYIIAPQGRKSLVVDPPSSTASHTITVPYIQKPAPVYSDYGFYRFDNTAMLAIVKYAAWLYKYRDSEPNFGDAWYKFWLATVTASGSQLKKALDRTSFRVNMIKRTLGSRSYR